MGLGLHDTILHQLEDGVGTVTLNRPDKLNALTPEMLKALPQIFQDLLDDGARTIVLTGEGRGFCSGAQLGSDNLGDRDLGAVIDDLYNPLAEKIAELPVPFVTAVNGIAAGAGASLALSGDIVIAARNASFLLAFANIGLVPDAGASWTIAKSAGRIRTMEMALLGEKMPAEEAKTAGLVTRVVDGDTLSEATSSIANKLAAMPTMALGLIRKQIRYALDNDFSSSLAKERDNQRLAGFSEDHIEGVTAFREKRPANYVGK